MALLQVGSGRSSEFGFGNKKVNFLCRILLYVIFPTHVYVLSVTVLTLWVAPPEMFCSWSSI